MKNNWNEIEVCFQTSKNDIKFFKKEQVINGNTLLDTVVNNANTIIINDYLRILCSGNSLFENILIFNNEYKNVIGKDKYAIAYDIFGGVFALTNIGVSYFAPDTLVWESLEMTYENFIDWITTAEINEFYSSFLWSNYNEYIKNLSNDYGVLFYPFLWSKECDVETASKKIVSFNEIMEINFSFSDNFEN